MSHRWPGGVAPCLRYVGDVAASRPWPLAGALIVSETRSAWSATSAVGHVRGPAFAAWPVRCPWCFGVCPAALCPAGSLPRVDRPMSCSRPGRGSCPDASPECTRLSAGAVAPSHTVCCCCDPGPDDRRGNLQRYRPVSCSRPGRGSCPDASPACTRLSAGAVAPSHTVCCAAGNLPSVPDLLARCQPAQCPAHCLAAPAGRLDAARGRIRILLS